MNIGFRFRSVAFTFSRLKALGQSDARPSLNALVSTSIDQPNAHRPHCTCRPATQSENLDNYPRAAYAYAVFVSQFSAMRRALAGKLRTITICFVFLPFAAAAQSVTSNTSSGTVKSFSVNAQSNFNVNTTATSSPGVQAIAEGNLILLPNSSLATGVNCSVDCSGTFKQFSDAGATTSSLNVNGSSSIQTLNIDPASTFKSSVDTGTATQTANQNSGSASAGMTAYSSLSVTEQTSTFTNTFTNTLQ